MKTKTLSSAALLLIAAAAIAAGPASPPVRQSPVWGAIQQHSIKTGDITVNTPVTGITTAQETYDILAPFDGRVEELHAELFGFVTPVTVVGRMVSTEMAALLDSSSEESRKQTERRWKDIYSYTEIKPETQGLVTNIYVESGTRVNKGDRLFTVARKVVIIGKNTEMVYSKLAAGMTARVEYGRNPDVKFETRLANYLSLKGSPLIYRLWLEVLDFKGGIKIGEQFNGTLFVGKSTNAMLAPRQHVIESGGKRFLITEILTGLETAEEIEILKHSSVYLEPVLPPAEINNGKDKKAR